MGDAAPSHPRRAVQKVLILGIGVALSLWPVVGGFLDARNRPVPGEYAGPLFLLFLGFTLPCWLVLALIALGLLLRARMIKLGCAVGAALLSMATLALLVLYGGVQGATAMRTGAFPSSPGIPLFLFVAIWFAWIGVVAWLDRREQA